MPVTISCPTCGSPVRLLRDGFVQIHPGVAGRACTFVRTAHSAGVAPKVTPAATIAKPPKMKQAALVKVAKIRVTCAVCGTGSMRNADVTGPLMAHMTPETNRWCPGGIEPTAKQKKAFRKPRGWTVSGGLPTLGRR